MFSTAGVDFNVKYLCASKLMFSENISCQKRARKRSTFRKCSASMRQIFSFILDLHVFMLLYVVQRRRNEQPDEQPDPGRTKSFTV